MLITSISTDQLNVPLNKPMRTRYFNLEHACCLLVTIKTDTGFEGQGLVRSANQPDIEIVEKFIETIFKPKLIGNHFSSPEQLWQSLWLHKRNHLQSSFGLYALAAIDIAIWDIKAQLENKPLHQLFGITDDFVIPY
jgi:L-rhamnonate dehydratase